MRKTKRLLANEIDRLVSAFNALGVEAIHCEDIAMKVSRISSKRDAEQLLDVAERIREIRDEKIGLVLSSWQFRSKEVSRAERIYRRSRRKQMRARAMQNNKQ